jgi:hypothetical protein
LKNILFKAFLFLMIIGVIYMFIKGYESKQEIETNRGETICKYTFCKEYPKTNSAFVKYFVNGKVYRNQAGRCPDKYSQTINKYYELKYSKIDPNKIIVDFSTEVKDKALIVELESKLTFKYWMEH